MKGQSISKRTDKTPFFILGVILLLLISFVFLLEGMLDSRQANSPMIAGVCFSGDYKIGEGEWHQIVPGEHISSTKGDVTLKGQFLLLDPQTNEVICPLPSDITVFLYFNHIAGNIVLPNGKKIIFDAENENFGEAACSSMWGSFVTVDASSYPDPHTVQITLHNPHRFGNENAIDDFLENLSVAPGIIHESIMLEKGEVERGIGMVILISALIIFGISVFSTIIHIKYSREMWLIGLMSFFAGGYFLFDAFAVSIWNDSYMFNTRAIGLCIMLYMLSVSSLITLLLSGRLKKIAAALTAVSAVGMLFCIFFSYSEHLRFFDSLMFWTAAESVVCFALTICLILSFKGSTATRKIFLSVGIITLVSFLTDGIATALGYWEGGLISKHVFLAVFMMALVIVLRIIPAHINTVIRARQLESERQALRLELQESRISIMLSQMQPHFIFNTLNTIYHLCELNPETAKSTISSFSEYLRNNIDNLGRSEMISFEKELSFVETYLNIEKVRFDDELEIRYDIKVTNFKLPVLTVQPIVENAVKHGTSKKEGVSTLSLSTRETDTCYEILIEDTGVGFNTEESVNDNHRHIGISSVKQRLHNLCDGTLVIESTVGVGTKALITIPKKEA